MYRLGAGIALLSDLFFARLPPLPPHGTPDKGADAPGRETPRASCSRVLNSLAILSMLRTSLDRWRKLRRATHNPSLGCVLN